MSVCLRQAPRRGATPGGPVLLLSGANDAVSPPVSSLRAVRVSLTPSVPAITPDLMVTNMTVWRWVLNGHLLLP